MQRYSAPNLKFFKSTDKSFGMYLKDISKIPLLSREEEKKLAKKAFKGDRKAKDALVRHNLRFVISIANKYRPYTSDYVDLVNEGNIGLITAIEHYNPSKNVKLSSYAYHWIKQAIMNYLACKAGIIRLNPKFQNILFRLNSPKYRKTPMNKKYVASHLKEVSKEIGFSTADVTRVINFGETLSLDSTFASDDEAHVFDVTTLLNPILPDQQDGMEQAQTQNIIQEALNVLTPREKDVLSRRFGLNGYESQTLAEVGDAYGISRERIRQVQNIGLTKMKALLKRKDFALSA